MFVPVKLSLVYALLHFTICTSMRKNVCKTLKDYRTMQTNPNCWYNPDVGATPKQLAKRYGYPFESYKVTTEDGYQLTVFRIPHNGSDVTGKRQPVFLQHGIACDAASFMANGIKSIVFVFANNGYDVWLSNSRGTTVSSKHSKYTVFDPEYWNFSYHELALYDVPATMEFILSKTGRKSIYVGHSMGTTMSYIYASLKPVHAENHLKSVISLAPIAYMDNTLPAPKLMAHFRYLIWDSLTSLGIYAVGQNIQSKVNLFRNLCSGPLTELCVRISETFQGVNEKETAPEILPVFVYNYFNGMSLKTLLHFGQTVASGGRFPFFDYGPSTNLKLYNSSIPPEYPLSRIKLPVYLFYGNRDGLASEKDVLRLFDKLETKKEIMEVFNFQHFAFLGSKHSSDLYVILLRFMAKD